MPIRYDSILLGALAAELDGMLRGADVGWVSFDAEHRTVRLVARNRPTVLFSLSPRHGWVLALDDPGPRPGREVLSAWRDLAIGAVITPPDERRLTIDLVARGDQGRPRSLVVEFQTNGWNAVIVASGTGRIEEVLWARRVGGRVLERGARYDPHRDARNWQNRVPTAAEWSSELESVEPGDRRSEALERFAGLSTINVDSVLGDWGSGGSADSLISAWERYAAMRNVASRPAEAWILDRRLGPQPYPTSLEEVSAVPAESVLDAMRTARTPYTDEPETPPSDSPDPEVVALRAALVRRLSRARRRSKSLGRELESSEDTAGLRGAGQLLLARKSLVHRGETSVVIPGFDGVDVEITLDPALGPVENAEKLFDEARRRERAAARIPALIEAAQHEAQRIEVALERLESSGASDHLWELVGGQPEGGRAARPGATPVRLPYRIFRTTGGLEIRVGRGARANDELTLRHSAPDDIWLHARQSAGAHVILRWGRRDQNPPRADLEEAAVVAAVHSEARHSGMVAVDWTRRKYVRKPRKSPPGSVIPERVKTLFVEPDPDLPARLAVPT